MSTNYYIDKKDRLPMEDLIHIGKAVFKKPNGEFIWAIEPGEFIQTAKETTGLRVVDECGAKYTYFQFMEQVYKRNWNCDHVGTSFS